MKPTFYKTGTTVGRYWKEILALVSDAIIIYDEHGAIQFANQSALLNLRFDTVAGLPIDSIDGLMDRFIVTDDNGASVGREEMLTSKALRSESPEGANLHFTELNGKEDYWLSAKAFPIFDTKHHVRYIVVIFHDISIFKTTEANLKDANRRMMGMLEGFLETHS